MDIRKLTALSVTAIFMTACQTTKMADTITPLSVDFSWDGSRACSSRPPAFHITQIPPETQRLRFLMTDMDVPTFYHGGGTVPYDGSGQIAAGAFSYKGPCPPSGSHRYRWTVSAIDANDTIIAQGETTKSFPPE